MCWIKPGPDPWQKITSWRGEQYYNYSRSGKKTCKEFLRTQSVVDKEVCGVYKSNISGLPNQCIGQNKFTVADAATQRAYIHGTWLCNLTANCWKRCRSRLATFLNESSKRRCMFVGYFHPETFSWCNTNKIRGNITFNKVWKKYSCIFVGPFHPETISWYNA